MMFFRYIFISFFCIFTSFSYAQKAPFNSFYYRDIPEESKPLFKEVLPYFDSFPQKDRAQWIYLVKRHELNFEQKRQIQDRLSQWVSHFKLLSKQQIVRQLPPAPSIPSFSSPLVIKSNLVKSN